MRKSEYGLIVLFYKKIIVYFIRCEHFYVVIQGDVLSGDVNDESKR